jgi:hypothetical protein
MAGTAGSSQKKSPARICGAEDRRTGQEKSRSTNPATVSKFPLRLPSDKDWPRLMRNRGQDTASCWEGCLPTRPLSQCHGPNFSSKCPNFIREQVPQQGVSSRQFESGVGFSVIEFIRLCRRQATALAYFAGTLAIQRSPKRPLRIPSEPIVRANEAERIFPLAWMTNKDRPSWPGCCPNFEPCGNHYARISHIHGRIRRQLPSQRRH